MKIVYMLITLAVCSITASAAEPTHPKLQKELLAAEKEDQAIRKRLFAKGAQNLDQDVAMRMKSLDTKNQIRLKAIIAEYGWPTCKMVGANGVHAAFIILQHANRDPAFQKSMLPALKKSYAAGDIKGNSIALLTDRILVGEGKPQLYGTQANIINGEAIYNEIEQPKNLDKRRAELGLCPHAQYKEMMSKFYQLNTAKEQADIK